MKTLTKVFSVWCWCMCMCTFVFAEKQAVTQDEILNPTLEPLTQLITPEQKLQILNDDIARQKAAELQIIEAKRLFVLDQKLQLANNLMNSNGDPISIEIQNNEITLELEKVKEELIIKGYTVEEYLNDVNGYRI